MQTVTITRTARAHYAPTLGNGPVYQPSRTIVTMYRDGEYLEIVDTAVTSHVHNLMGNMIRMDLTDLTPAELDTHDAIAGYWYAVALGWAAGAELEVA